MFNVRRIRIAVAALAAVICSLAIRPAAAKPIPWEGGDPHKHLMGPLPPSSIFYDARTKWPQISLVGVTNFIWHFFEPDTFRRIVRPKFGTYLLPEKVNGNKADIRADQ